MSPVAEHVIFNVELILGLSLGVIVHCGVIVDKHKPEIDNVMD